MASIGYNPTLQIKLDTKGALLRCETAKLNLQISLGQEIVERLRRFSEAMQNATEKVKELKLSMDKSPERCEV